MPPRARLDDWYKHAMGEDRSTKWTNAADVEAVLRHPQLMLRGDASTIASQTGVISTAPQLANKALEVAGMERVFEEMKGHGAEAVREKLRTPCPLQPLHEATPTAPIGGAVDAPLPLANGGPFRVDVVASPAAPGVGACAAGEASYQGGLFESAGAEQPSNKRKQASDKRAQQIQQLRERRRRLRMREAGTTEEQQTEDARYKNELLARNNNKRKKN